MTQQDPILTAMIELNEAELRRYDSKAGCALNGKCTLCSSLDSKVNRLRKKYNELCMHYESERV